MTKAAILTQGRLGWHLVRSGDTLRLSPLGAWGAIGIRWLEARGAAQHPAMHRMPHSRELSSPNVSVMLRFLALEPEDVEKQIL